MRHRLSVCAFHRLLAGGASGFDGSGIALSSPVVGRGRHELKLAQVVIIEDEDFSLEHFETVQALTRFVQEKMG